MLDTAEQNHTPVTITFSTKGKSTDKTTAPHDHNITTLPSPHPAPHPDPSPPPRAAIAPASAADRELAEAVARHVAEVASDLAVVDVGIKDRRHHLRGVADVEVLVQEVSALVLELDAGVLPRVTQGPDDVVRPETLFDARHRLAHCLGHHQKPRCRQKLECVGTVAVEAAEKRASGEGSR